MNLAEIEAAIAEIKAESEHYDESAHLLLDKLQEKFISHVCGLTDPVFAELQKMAILIASTSEIEINRWYE